MTRLRLFTAEDCMEYPFSALPADGVHKKASPANNSRFVQRFGGFLVREDLFQLFKFLFDQPR